MDDTQVLDVKVMRYFQTSVSFLKEGMLRLNETTEIKVYTLIYR